MTSLTPLYLILEHHHVECQSRDRLPVSATTRAISLGEGNTPLIKLDQSC